ncbi:MAG: sugar nucleotidyltransferase [Planctomycetes bacterium]|nr:sugar nucleotidyltransferase [Planctomycetota bacterium]
MKGVILAGGRGVRLRPLTECTNKHLLPVAGEPMLRHPLRKLAEAGIEDILIVAGDEHLEPIRETFGEGGARGSRLLYRGQDRPRGIAHALGMAEAFAEGGPICAILGDNIFEDPLAPHLETFLAQGEGALLLVKRVADPRPYGVARVEGDRVVEIEEKPWTPASDLAVTGIYFYDGRVFERLRGLRPSARGELEVTDLNNAYARRGEARFAELRGWWVDAGTFEGLAEADRRLRGQRAGDPPASADEPGG